MPELIRVPLVFAGLTGPAMLLRSTIGAVDRLPWLPIIWGLKMLCFDWRKRESSDAEAQRDDRGKKSATAVRVYEFMAESTKY